MCVLAQELAKMITSEKRTRCFEGSLQNGLDMKETIRSCIRGEDRLHVKIKARQKNKTTKGYAFDPTLLIFTPDPCPEYRWRMFIGDMVFYHQDHVRDRNLFNQVCKEKGTNFVGWVGYEERIEVPFEMAEFGMWGILLSGMVISIQACFDGE
jgi:hypothetical protein